MSFTSSLPAFMTASLCVEILSIQMDQEANLTKDRDLFIAPTKEITLTLNNGSLTRIRDVVVLGKLTIQSATRNGKKAHLMARNLIVGGSCSLNTINLVNKNTYEAGESAEFQENLRNRVIEWLEYQREITNQMGLRSVFN